MIVAILLDDGDTILSPLQRVLLHVGCPADGCRLVAVRVVNLIYGDVECGAFKVAGLYAAALYQTDDHLPF